MTKTLPAADDPIDVVSRALDYDVGQVVRTVVESQVAALSGARTLLTSGGKSIKNSLGGDGGLQAHRRYELAMKET